MTLIEGIGDEVIHFFFLLAIILIALFAWWSTNISERPLIRTVLILERRATRPIPTDNHNGLGDLRDGNEITSGPNELQAEQKTSQSNNDTNNQIEVNVVEHFDNIFVNREEIQSAMENFTAPEDIPKPNCSHHQIEGSGDSSETDKSSVLRNRRIAFFQHKDDPIETQKEEKCSKSLTDESTTSAESEIPSPDEGNIRIRLKYLNDDQKLVEGKLQEQLGDFKRRHFSLELAGRKLVRLIFNGKVLQQDSKTLQNYGFFDNCVVHCLVQQPRTPPPSPNLNRPRSEVHSQNDAVHHHWDLGNILFASLSFLLGLAWYGRYQYAQLYTATTTVALIGLTGMFTVSLIGMYMPDVDGVRTQ